MELNSDFNAFFELLNKHNVRYVIVGGYAVVFHGYPRYTGDIDILYEANPANIEALLAALRDFGFDFKELTVEELSKLGQVIQLGQPPRRIDLMNSITNGSFTEIWKNKVAGQYGDQPVYYIHLKDLQKNKEAVARTKDRLDLEMIKEK